jgi:hypothetical protein
MMFDRVFLTRPNMENVGTIQKCSDARRAVKLELQLCSKLEFVSGTVPLHRGKNRTARRIQIYVERCGLQLNAAGERFSTVLQVLL